MNDLKCPYCDAPNEVCHDDGQGYEEGKAHEMTCGDCGKNFVFQTSISFYYSPGNPAVVQERLVRHWRFPMGEKTVDIYIHGDGELTEEDDECFRDFLDASHRTFNVRIWDDDPRNPKYKGACGGTMGNEYLPNATVETSAAEQTIKADHGKQ